MTNQKNDENYESFIEHMFRWLKEFYRKQASEQNNESGQDIAEYAVMLAVIIVIVVGVVKLIGGNANNVFSLVASSLK